MAQKLFEIVLADGTRIENLKLNGNNFISQDEITEATFSGKLKTVQITGPEEHDEAGLIGTHEHMELIQIRKYDNEYWFILRDIPADELERIKINARLDYIEMMEDL